MGVTRYSIAPAPVVFRDRKIKQKNEKIRVEKKGGPADAGPPYALPHQHALVFRMALVAELALIRRERRYVVAVVGLLYFR